ncbi:lanthionine synthetase C family protein [Nocardiopsis dassonvillei]
MSVSAPTMDAVAAVAERIAAHLDGPTPGGQPWLGQSLGEGAAGIALVHIERAHTGRGTWQHAHRWIKAAVSEQVSAADTTGLFLGATAIAFVLASADTGPAAGRYTAVRAGLDAHVVDLAHRRVDVAMERIRRGECTSFGEYDTFYGLTGIGAYLLRQNPGGSAMGRVLGYLVALIRPVVVDGESRPGWWVEHDPRREYSAHFAGGHGNLGVAHGIAGPLMLLSQAQRRGVTVPGQVEAIAAILAHLDQWCQASEQGPWWPEHLTVRDLAVGRPHQLSPARPSWCYGTPGIARAGQLAALATGDQARQRVYEHALEKCLADPAQMGRLRDGSLCHGWAGVYQTTWRAALDATTPDLATHLPTLATALIRHAEDTTESGLLEGRAGSALALSTAATDAAPLSGWDACLLID